MSNKLKLLFLLLCFTSLQYAQGLKVLITEEKRGKRVELYAENKTADSLNVFLMVNAEGYRRSASKPVIEDIPPYGKVHMITLIELAEAQSQYTFELVVNDKSADISMEFDSMERDIERVVSNKLVVFTVADCSKCDLLKSLLDTQRVSYRSFDIHKDKKLYAQFMSFIERQLTEETKIRMPVIWNRDEVIFGYDDVERIVRKLSIEE